MGRARRAIGQHAGLRDHDGIAAGLVVKGLQRTGREVVALPLPLLVNLVNTWGTEPRKACGKSAQAHPTLSAWRATSPLAWRQFPRLSASELVEVVDLIYPVFAAGSVRE